MAASESRASDAGHHRGRGALARPIEEGGASAAFVRGTTEDCATIRRHKLKRLALTIIYLKFVRMRVADDIARDTPDAVITEFPQDVLIVVLARECR